MPPSGTTAERPQSCAAGTIRFNTDIGTLEVYKGDGIGWEQIVKRESQYLGGGTGSNAGTGTRGLFGLGFISPTGTNQMNFVTVQTLGNTQDFGDLMIGTKKFRLCIIINSWCHLCWRILIMGSLRN